MYSTPLTKRERRIATAERGEREREREREERGGGMGRGGGHCVRKGKAVGVVAAGRHGGGGSKADPRTTWGESRSLR